MIPRGDLRSIARARLRDAKVLLRAKRFDGAVYLCGYAVELALKARLCRTLRWHAFPETPQEFKGLQSVKTHDLEILLRLSGVEARIKARYLTEWSVVLNMIPTSRLRKAMRDIEAEKGPFTLFGLFMRTDSPGTWDLVVSAPWLEKGKLKALGELTQALSRALGEKSLQQLSRVVTLSDDNPGLAAILSAVSVDDGEVRLQRSSFFGLDIEDAYIFRARRAA